MKIKSLLVGMLACTAMVSCTNEEVLENNEVVKGGEKSYMSVNLVAPSSVSGRAAEDFVAGSDDEVKVNNAVFLFLDENFAGCAEPFTTGALTFGDAEGEGRDKEATVLVIDGAKEVPTYLVAILNPVGTYTAATTLDELKAETATYTNYTAQNFVMSNAVYKASNGKEVAATPVTMDYIFDTAEKAEAKPLTIQVERVVGKVAFDLNDADEKWDGDEQIDDAEEKELKLVVTGWDILQNLESTLVKNIDLAWSYSWWNDETLKRSYWANDYTQAGRNKLLVDDMTNPEFRYVEETVCQTPQTEEAIKKAMLGDNQKPYLVVAGEFVDAKTGEKVELVEWRGRKYTKEGYLNFIAGNSKVSQYWTKSGDEYTSFSVELLKMVKDEEVDWLASAQLVNPSAEFYTCDYDGTGKPVQGSWKKAADGVVAAAIAEFGKVQYWNGGNTYYYTPIKHVTDGTDNFYGVVRNHVYNVTIKSISGYGTPVSDPENAIEIPEKPVDDDSFLAAEVVILDWKIVNNEVELN